MILFFLALLSVCLIATFRNKHKAKEVCEMFEKMVYDSFLPLKNNLVSIISNKSYDYHDGIISPKAQMYLISKEVTSINIYTINTNMKKIVHGKQYSRLCDMLKDKPISYKYSIGLFSIYYCYSSPLEDNFLIINYP